VISVDEQCNERIGFGGGGGGGVFASFNTNRVEFSGRAYRGPTLLRSFSNNRISNQYLNKQHKKERKKHLVM
jgi:hypothetical protein